MSTLQRLLADRRRLLLAVGALLLAGYVALAVLLAAGKDWSSDGPLAFDHPPLTASQLAELGHTEAELRSACFPTRDLKASLLIMSGLVGGQRFFACYDARPGGTVYDVVVVGDELAKVKDPDVLKPSGVWPWYGVVKSTPELVLGAFGCLALFAVGALTASRVRRRSPAPAEPRPWWGRPIGLVLLAIVPVVGWIAIAFLPRVPAATKTKAVLIAVASYGLLFVLGLLFSSVDKQDAWGIAVLSYLLGTLVIGLLLGWWATPATARRPRRWPRSPRRRPRSAGASHHRPPCPPAGRAGG